MLKKRIIPTLLFKDFGLVKGSGFNNWRRIGPVLPAIKVYNTREVDELIFLDVANSETLNEPDYEVVDDLSKHCFVPLTVGGGITRIDQVQKLLSCGADKVSINSSAYENPDLIKEIVNTHGSQSIVGSIDAKKINNNWICFSNSGKKETKYDPVTWAKNLEELGVGEILITSIDRDGTMSGYDQDLISAVTGIVNIPVIASGGAGEYSDMEKAILGSGASAVAAASIFHFTECTPAKAKEYLERKGIPIRKNFL